MKKLFALFLLVALVPFTVGCGLFGDNDDTSPITTATLSLSRLFPAGTFGGSLRGATTVAINYSDLFMYVTVSGNKIKLSYKKHTPKAAGVEVEFAAPVLPSVIETINTNNSVVAEVLVQNTQIVNPVTIVPQATIAITTDLPTTGTTSTPTVLETAPITTIPAEADVLKAIETANPTLGTVTAASYEAVAKYGTNNVSDSMKTPTMIMLENGKYNFSATFNQDYANAAAPTFTITVNHINKTTGAVITSKTFKSSDTTSPIAVTWSDKKTASIVVTPNSTYDLTSGETYHIALTATDAYATVSGVKVLPTLPSFFVKAH